MILKLLLSILMICMMSVKILMIRILTKINMINNKKLNSIVTELFIRGRKLNISLAFITHTLKFQRMLV